MLVKPSMDPRHVQWVLCLAAVMSVSSGRPVMADVRLPSIFSEHLVLQQGQPNPVWGWAEPGERVTVTLADQSHSATAAADGRWKVVLSSLPAGGPHVLEVRGANVIKRDDVLIGEVWICSGEANMEFPVEQVQDADLEILAANYSRIRLLGMPHVGSQQPKEDFEGQWRVCSSATVSEFSAVGYYFARQLHQTLSVPVGLIDNAWGDSTCEAWVRQDVLAADERYAPLLASWLEMEKSNGNKEAVAPEEEPSTKRQKGKSDSPQRQFKQRRDSAAEKPIRKNPLEGPRRPGNLFQGVLWPIRGYGIRGVIWYQGGANIQRAYQYRHLFPLMIKHWRDEWGQGDFPFYWVQLAGFKGESDRPHESARAELREAQSMTLTKLPNTGEVVTIDVGEDAHVHPQHGQVVAHRLARWALARDYGVVTPHESPRYDSLQKMGSKIVVRFNGARDRNAALRTSEGAEPIGFAVAGADKRFVSARARIAGNYRVEVWSDEIPEPMAVRYAWGDNALGNLQSRSGLPVTPFRTDDWPGVTVGADTSK